jgi:hypothetical protein
MTTKAICSISNLRDAWLRFLALRRPRVGSGSASRSVRVIERCRPVLLGISCSWRETNRVMEAVGGNIGCRARFEYHAHGLSRHTLHPVSRAAGNSRAAVSATCCSVSESLTPQHVEKNEQRRDGERALVSPPRGLLAAPVEQSCPTSGSAERRQLHARSRPMVFTRLAHGSVRSRGDTLTPCERWQFGTAARFDHHATGMNHHRFGRRSARRVTGLEGRAKLSDSGNASSARSDRHRNARSASTRCATVSAVSVGPRKMGHSREKERGEQRAHYRARRSTDGCAITPEATREPTVSNGFGSRPYSARPSSGSPGRRRRSRGQDS